MSCRAVIAHQKLIIRSIIVETLLGREVTSLIKIPGTNQDKCQQEKEPYCFRFTRIIIAPKFNF